MARLRVGDRVQVNDCSGIFSGKIGNIISKKEIPLNDKGVPKLPGHYHSLQPREVGIRMDDGTIFVMYINRLAKVPS